MLLKEGAGVETVRSAVLESIPEDSDVIFHGDNGNLLMNFRITQSIGRRRTEAASAARVAASVPVMTELKAVTVGPDT